VTAAVRALLTLPYWLAIATLEFILVPWLLLVVLTLPWWWAALAAVAAGVAVGGVAAAVQGLILDRIAARIAARIEQLAAEWREITATPTLPPCGGEIDGQTRPATERLTS
jgi:hypothetical protein